MLQTKGRRQSLFRTSPEFFRRTVVVSTLSLVLFFVFFGIDLLDWLFLRETGTSALSGVRDFINSSLGLRLIILVASGWALFDIAFNGGIRVASGPYFRFIQHVEQVPFRLPFFHLRKGDESFQIVSESYNEMLRRIHDQSVSIIRALDQADTKQKSIQKARREINRLLEGLELPPELALEEQNK